MSLPPSPPPLLLPLAKSFFLPGARDVAAGLLGHWLVRRTPQGPAGGLIVETEAYVEGDPACHAFRGQTARNRSMFGPPGCAYVYFIYGNHWCFNVVCRPVGIAEAVLVRAIEPSFGIPWMTTRRPVDPPRELTNGPAKLCAALDIDRRFDGMDLCDAAGEVLLAGNPERDRSIARSGPVVNGPRIGIRQAAGWPLRFYLEGSDSVSRRPRRARGFDSLRQVKD